MAREQSKYGTSIKRLVLCVEAAKEGKDISSGIWTSPTWTPEKFWQWFHSCLNRKINRKDRRERTYRKMQEEHKQYMRRDARIINDYARRVMRRGLNVLSTPEMRAKYPHINNNMGEEI